MSSGPDLSTLDFDNLERKEVVACRLKVPDHAERDFFLIFKHYALCLESSEHDR